MAESEQTREVSFRVCIGLEKNIHSVAVCVYDPGITDKPIKEVQCVSHRIHGVWSTLDTVTLPLGPLLYRYKIDFQGSFSLTNMLKEFVGFETATSTAEEGLRQLPGAIHSCLDVYKPHDFLQKPQSVIKGLRMSLQALLDSTTTRSIKEVLLQLEHTWRSLDKEFLETAIVKTELCQWVQQSLGICSKKPFSLVLLSVFYGKLTQHYAVELSGVVKLYDGKAILKAFAYVNRDQLPDCCVSSLQSTALHVLTVINKSHWVCAAAYFPFLFDLGKVLDLRSELNGSDPHPELVEKVLIPKIQEGYIKDEARVILKEIGAMYEAADNAANVRELIKTLTLPDKQQPFQLKTTRIASITQTPASRDPIGGAKANDDEQWSEEEDNLLEEEETSLGGEGEVGRQSQSNTASQVYVRFRVLVNDISITGARLLLIDQKEDEKVYKKLKMKISRVRSNVLRKDQWVLAEIGLTLPKLTCLYRYSISRIFCGSSKTYSFDIDENFTRDIYPPEDVCDVFLTAYDVKHEEERNKLQSQGGFFYADMLFRRLTSTLNLNHSLNQLEKHNFPLTNGGCSYYKSIIHWIQRRCFPGGNTYCYLTDPQRKYLAVIFGKVLSAGYNVSENDISEMLVHLLIETLQNSSFDDFPNSVTNDIKSTCVFLVRIIQETWLFPWVYFSRCLDLEALVTVCEEITTPRLRTKSWIMDKATVNSVLEKLEPNTDAVEKFFECWIGHIEDHRIFKEMFQICVSHKVNTSTVCTKAARQLQNIIHKRYINKLDDLSDLWKDPALISDPQIAEIIRQHMIKFLSHEDWYPDDSELIRRVVLDETLYKTSREISDVMEHIIHHFPQQYAHDLFVDVLKEPQLVGSISLKIMTELLEKAMISLALSFRVPEKHTVLVETVYKLLLVMRICTHISRHEQLAKQIGNLAYKIIKDIPIERLIGAICPRVKSTLPPEEQCIVSEHIKRRINDESDVGNETTAILKELPQLDGKLQVLSNPIRDVMIELLNKQEPIAPKVSKNQKTGTFEATMLKIIKNGDFWLTILQSEGDFSRSLMQHTRTREVIEAIQQFEELLKQGRLTIAFVRQMTCKNEEVILQLLSTSCDSEQDTYKTELHDLHELERQFRIKTDCLCVLLDTCVDGLSNVVQLQNINELSAMLRHLQKPETEQLTLLTDTQKELFWGCLTPLLSLSMELQNIASSVMFINVCRSAVTNANLDYAQERLTEEPMPSVISGPNGSTPSQSMETKGPDVVQSMEAVTGGKKLDSNSYANMLKEVCLPVFDEYCRERIFSENPDVPVKFLTEMMIGILTEKSLDAEMDMLCSFFNRDIPSKQLDAIRNLVLFPELSKKLKQLERVLTIFKVTKEPDDAIYKALNVIDACKILSENDEECQLKVGKLHKALETIISFEKDLQPEGWDIIEQLAESQELVSFLYTLVDEDLRNLIDAVEERSEQHVNESTVSDFIDVKRYLEPLLKLTEKSAEGVFNVMKMNRSNMHDIKHMALKINTCHNNIHSLRDLYNNVANRGEMTKEIVMNALQSGLYIFKMETGSEYCHVVLKYQRGSSEAIYGLDQLNDLRSRALLLANSREQELGRRMDDEAVKSIPLYRDFVKSVETVNKITRVCERLVQSGHFSFRDFEENANSIDQLNGILTRLQRQFDHWKQALDEAREKYYFLNFFHSRQLWQLDQFFAGKMAMSYDILLLFKLIDIEINANNSFVDYNVLPSERNNLTARLFHLGEALRKVVDSHTLVNRPIPGNIKAAQISIDTKVIRGALFVAELEKGSSNSVPVLLRLYANTTGYLPEANQVLFCHANTSWEEIELLLKRCVGALRIFESDKLYSLVNVELLPTEVQFRLVTELKDIQKTHNDFLLCLLCRGGSYHHIIDQFSPQYTHCLPGLTYSEMNSCLRTGWPNVEVVTSSEAGLGKTEYVKYKATQLDLGVSTLPISGPIDKDSLVKLVKLQMIAPYELFHIDLAPMSDAGLFDCFLFEMVVVGMAVSGTQLCMMPSADIVIEVANTHQDKLRNALTISSSFQRRHLQWTGFSNFVVSEDPNSPIQVACHYLQALEDTSIDTKDIMLVGQCQVSPIPAKECRRLVSKCFKESDILTYTLVDTFLVILAQELRRMSASLYFTIKTLNDMLGDRSNDVRSGFVKALIDVSLAFSSRAVKQQPAESTHHIDALEALHEYRSAVGVSAEQMVARTQGMVKWAESNHLLLVFHRQDSQTISALYRMLNRVPPNIIRLFETQMKKNLRNYHDLTQDELQTILEKVVRSTRTTFQKDKLEELKTNYALTPDNLLKMVLIHMRVKSRIPVIIMGETGCGKTTLITYLARVCEVSFDVLNLHAGIAEDEIIRFVTSLIFQAEGNMKMECWGFLDEINTCEHLGLLNEILCHRTLKGVPLPTNLFFLGACNPYRLRESETSSAGLAGKQRDDELSKLVYRVHPLPETMMDYVWDYGSLDRKDEEAYIRRMLEGKHETFVELVIMSQGFMRITQKTSYCVSLRDVNRCQHLVKWFMKMFKHKKPAPLPGGKQHYCSDTHIRSEILALAHCYYSRLTKPENRLEYKQKIASIISKKQHVPIIKGHIEEVIEAEQLDFLNRMQLPEGTAKNEALRENVFVILVSILNRIPVFVVGMPGCSKSLSMQLIRSELRGPDSKDFYFKKLPSLYVVSYQGSESSTSEGIITVFEKAKNYKKHKPGVMPVVLLDEIGLAEVSSFNPLKVLHSLLEPTIGGFPPVAVVGISNWALDAAKMNRAIHLSRPEPSIADLAKTALSIQKESDQYHTSTSLSEEKLCGLAKAYNMNQKKQKHQNFHGLRDFYSLVKYIAMQTTKHSHEEPSNIITKGILRNFGGLPKQDTQDILESFTEKMNVTHKPGMAPPVMELIEDNLTDKYARHLMLITNGDSALDILERTLQDREHVMIFGSHFEHDNSEEYNYKILSEIILCMERGVILVLRDLESIYGSLYDMLNQNYTWVGKKRNCRVALGPYSNPMCQVHDNFRCIVLVDENKVDFQNPPFLNRFEKQTLRFSDILNERQKSDINFLERWVKDITTIEGYHFSREDAFLGMHDDTLPSLVCYRSQRTDVSDVSLQELSSKCQNDLLMVACPDAVLRASSSKLAEKYRAQVTKCQRWYFDLPQHNGLKQFLEDFTSLYQRSDIRSAIPLTILCSRLVIYTHSSIHTNIENILQGTINVQVEKLSSFKSEQSFSNQMRHFWFESNSQLLVLQCMTSVDAPNMLLAKCRLDQFRKEYLKSSSKEPEIKHVCLIVHIDRRQKLTSYSWQFNFLCGWNQCTLDSLEPSTPSLNEVLQRPLSDLFTSTIDMNPIIEEQLLWCFGCIKYEGKTRHLESAVALVNSIASSPELMSCLQLHVLKHLRISATSDSQLEVVPFAFEGWQIDVACRLDEIYGASTLTGAMMSYIKSRVKIPLAKTIIFLESSCAWTGSPIDRNENEDVAAFWQLCFKNGKLFDINSMDIPEPHGIESCLVDCAFLQFKFPFFLVFHRLISRHRDWLLNQNLNIAVNEEERGVQNIVNQLVDIISSITELQYEDYVKYHVHEYLEDLFNMFAVDHADNLPDTDRIRCMNWLIKQVSSSSEDPDAVRVIAHAYAVLWFNSNLLAAQLQLFAIYVDVCNNQLDSLIRQLEKSTGDDKQPKQSLNSNQEFMRGLIDEERSITEDMYPPSVPLEGHLFSDECNEQWQGLDGLVEQESTDDHEDKLATVTQAIDFDHTTAATDGMFEHRNNGDETGMEDMTPDTIPSTKAAASTKSEVQQATDQQIEKLFVNLTLDEECTKPAASDPDSETSYLDTPQTMLVTEVCRSILPTESTLEQIDGVEEWQRKASRVLLLAGKVSVESPVLHFLRLCRDFVVMIGLDFNITDEQLQTLSEMGKDSNDPLETEEVFEFVCSTVYELMTNESETRRLKQLEDFLCLFFGLCLESNLDTQFLPQILQALCKESGELLSGARPVLLDLLKSEMTSSNSDDVSESKEASSSVYKQIIFAKDLQDKSFGNLPLIDDVLQDCDDQSQLPIACCDIIEDVAFGNVTYDLLAEVKSDESQLVKTVSEAYQIVTSAEGYSLKVVTAAAYLRSYLSAFAVLIEVSSPSSFQLNGKHVVLANITNSLLRTTSGADAIGEPPLKAYLLKSLRKQKSLFHLRKWCANAANPLPDLKGIQWQQKLFATRLGYTPLNYVDHYAEAFSAISESQVKRNTADLLLFIEKARSSSGHRLGLLGAVADAYYFVQTAKGLRDSDESHSRLLFEHAAGISPICREFIKRLIGMCDFDGVLQVSESTDEEILDIVSVIIHLTSIAAANATNNTELLLACFTNKSKENTFFPRIGMALPILKHSYQHAIEVCDCICGHRLIHNQSCSFECCPACGKNRRKFTNIQKAVEQYQIDQEASPEVQQRQCISPSSYLTINILVECAFLANESLGLLGSSTSAYQNSGNVDELFGASSMKQPEEIEHQDITMERVMNAISVDWNALGDIIGVNHEGVALFINCVIRAINEANINLGYSGSAADQDRLEKALASIIDKETKRIPYNTTDFKRTCFERQGITLDGIEAEIEEIDDLKHSTLKSILRIRATPSFPDFKAHFGSAVHHHPDTYSFPFLQLYLERHEQIQYVKFLPSLLKWNCTVASRLSNRIKRNDAKRYTISDFLGDIRFNPDEQSRAEVSQTFRDFQHAWNSILEGWWTLTEEPPEFDQMTIQSTINHCVVVRDEPCSYLQRMICILQDIQNSFLMEALMIATQSHSPSLNFMVATNGIGVIRRTPINSAESSIIQYTWSDEILQYHDLGHEYGHGCVVEFKFNVIERDLARQLVLNKSILVEGSTFTQFSYSDDLYHSCSSILAELDTLIPQQRLSKELISSIEKEQDRRHNFAKEMLEHLEIILLLLKKTGGDREYSLQEFVRRWSTHLPGHLFIDMLPGSSDGVKLQHIVHLYEILEDLLMDGVIDNLHDQFRQDLPSGVAHSMSKKFKPCSVDQLQQLASVIRRFVFRFLRSGSETEARANLKDVMMRSYGANSQCQDYIDMIPEEVSVSHVMTVIDYISSHVKERENVTPRKETTRPIIRTTSSFRPNRRRRGGNVGGIS